MKFFKWVVFLFLISCTAGKKEVKNEITGPQPLLIYDDLPNPINQIDDLFEFEDLIPLAFPDSIFLSTISKVKLVGDDYLVLDKKQSIVFLFDESGEFVRTIGSKGEGPGEFLDVSDFEVDNGKVYLMSRGSRAVFVFDVESGDFVEKINTGLFGDKLVSAGNGELLIYVNHNSAKDSFNVHLIGSDGAILDSYFIYDPEKEKSIITISGFLDRTGQNVSFSKPFHDTVYTYDPLGKDFKARYYTDLLSPFMKENQRDFKALASPETLVKSVRGGESMNGNFYLENDGFVVFNFLDYSTFKSGILDKQDSEFKVFAYSSENPIFRLFDSPQVLTEDNKLYFPIYGEKLGSDDFFDSNFNSEFQAKLQDQLVQKGSAFPYFICISRIKKD